MRGSRQVVPPRRILCPTADTPVLVAPHPAGKQLTIQGTRTDGSTYRFPVNQTFNENQINWFKNGSALNAMAAQFKKQ